MAAAWPRGALRLLFLVLAGLVAVFPYVGLGPAFATSLPALWGASLGPLATSLLASALALAATALLGTPAAFLVASRRGSGRTVWEAAWMLLLVTPPLVLGLLLALALGPYALPGRLLGALGLSGANSFFALVVATFFESAPYYVLGALSAFTALPEGLMGFAATLGLGPLPAWIRVILPEALPGLVMALAMAWARAMGAFGAVVVLAYHPYGLTLWTWVQLETMGLPQSLAVALLLVLVAVPWPLLAWGWARRA